MAALHPSRHVVADDLGHRVTPLYGALLDGETPDALNSASAASTRSASRAGSASENHEERPSIRIVTSPQSRRHARCLLTVDCARCM